MTFFPFGIPSTASFAQNVKGAINLYTPSYSAAHALIARSGPPGSPAANPTDNDCGEGYTSAIFPTPPYTPVPSNGNVDRSGYILCFELPNASPTPTVTRTPSVTPSPTPAACYNLGQFNTGDGQPDITNCSGNIEYPNSNVTLYSTCAVLTTGCMVYIDAGCNSTTNATAITNGGTYYELNGGQVISTGTCSS